jgi:hypothetical protein
LKTLFTTTGGSACPIASYKLYQDDQGADAFTNNFFSVTDENTLKIAPPLQGGEFEFYV